MDGSSVREVLQRHTGRARRPGTRQGLRIRLENAEAARCDARPAEAASDHLRGSRLACWQGRREPLTGHRLVTWARKDGRKGSGLGRALIDSARPCENRARRNSDGGSQDESPSFDRFGIRTEAKFAIETGRKDRSRERPQAIPVDPGPWKFVERLLSSGSVRSMLDGSVI